MNDFWNQVGSGFTALGNFTLELSGDAARAYQRLSSRWKTVGCATAAMLLLALGWYVFSPSSVDIRLNLRHPFRSAELTVTIDGNVAYQGELNGAAHKKLLVLDRVEGSFTRNFDVRPGSHTVLVHIRSEAMAYDQQAQRTVEAAAGRGGTLLVTAKNGADLVMTWQPVPPAGDGGRMPGWLITLNSILLTALGAVFSAILGHYVQEFLKARKARSPVMTQAHETQALHS